MKKLIALLILFSLTTYSEEYFKVEHITPPEGLVLEVGGMCLDGNGGLMMIIGYLLTWRS